MRKALLFKFLLITLLSISLIISSTGCRRLGIEIVDLMIIQGIGIDKSTNGFIVTIEAINNVKNATVKGEGLIEKVSKIFVSEAESVAQALEDAIRISGREPLFAHNRVLIIGEETAKEGLSGMLDFFVRDYNAKPTVLLAIAKDATAQELLQIEMNNEIIVSLLLENILTESHKHGNALRVRMFEGINWFMDDTHNLAVPAVLIKEDAKENMLMVSGTAVFDKRNKLVGYLNDMETLGIAIFQHDFYKGFFNVYTSDGSNVTLRIENLRHAIKVVYEDEKVKLNFKVIAKCNIKGVESKMTNDITLEKADEIARLAEKRIAQIVASTVNAARNELKVDLMHIGKRLWITDVVAFESIREDWLEKLGSSDVQITTKVTIKRSGEEAIF
ncbi:MAG TPA: Ger(x)C family spore germination protein [Oscillospiraceae bacterium]|nr:Ger(x)C family spore germination protein [Oscillospiraceae bacterium]